MQYKIISTGSKGNAVVINNTILVDCGVSFKKLGDVSRNIKLVLLTHIHSDHINKKTIKRLTDERPTLRFGCCGWLIDILLDIGVNRKQIDIFEIGKIYDYKSFKISPVKLYHNVPNCGYRLFFDTGKVFYATDTNTLDGIEAKDYALYMVECNYEDAEIRQRIKNKVANGEYSYEIQAMNNHLSKQKCNDFIVKNAGPSSEFVYLHQHTERTDAK